MKLVDLQHDQQVRARCGRAGRERPRWGKWQDVRLHVQRTGGAALRSRLGREGGVLAVLALKKLDGTPINWAEYGGNDFDPKYKVFLVEDYYLEIEGLEA